MTPREKALEAAARAMWESEPIIYGWNHTERHAHPTWEDAVQRNLYGVGVYRRFAADAIATFEAEMKGSAGG